MEKEMIDMINIERTFIAKAEPVTRDEYTKLVHRKWSYLRTYARIKTLMKRK